MPIDPKKTDHLLGLFEPSQMQFEHDRLKDKQGALAFGDDLEIDRHSLAQ